LQTLAMKDFFKNIFVHNTLIFTSININL
jgi:hypothetical protein